MDDGKELHFYSGCFRSSVGEMLRHCFELLPELAIVRSLDSEDDANANLVAIRKFGVMGRLGSYGVWINKADLKVLIPRVFFGFDEVWFLSKSDADNTWERGAVDALTTDSGPMDIEGATLFYSFMSRHGVRLALGDGCGVNCITDDSRIWTVVAQDFQRIA